MLARAAALCSDAARNARAAGNSTLADQAISVAEQAENGCRLTGNTEAIPQASVSARRARGQQV